MSGETVDSPAVPSLARHFCPRKQRRPLAKPSATSHAQTARLRGDGPHLQRSLEVRTLAQRQHRPSHSTPTHTCPLPLLSTRPASHTASSADPAVLSRRRVACGVARLVCRDTRRRELERYPAYRAAAERGSTHQRREFVQYAHTIFITNTCPDMFEDTRPHRAVLQLWGGVRRAPRLMLPPGPR